MLLGLICSELEFGSSSAGEIISEFLELKGEGDLLLLLTLPTLQVDSKERRGRDNYSGKRDGVSHNKSGGTNGLAG